MIPILSLCIIEHLIASGLVGCVSGPRFEKLLFGCFCLLASHTSAKCYMTLCESSVSGEVNAK